METGSATEITTGPGAAVAGETGRVFDIQRYCIHDGPGIRTTVFLKGCPLRCTWCHNPEGIATQPEIIARRQRCIGCEQCRQVCPLSTASGSPSDGCTLCGRCVEACPTGARGLAGRSLTVGELVERVLRDRIFYDESGGGVSFSGGEPLAQPQFLLACLAALKEHELHTVVDTCGQAPQQVLLEAARLTDLFLYDLKLIDAQRHRALTGVGNEQILDNLAALGRNHRAIWLRVPVIPGLTDGSDNLQAIAGIAAANPAVRRLCLLPYHHTGKGSQESAAGLEPPSAQRLQELRALVEGAGVEVTIGG